ncbi:uncharacterized protein E0L32_008655 [Thyridium curvatum]|uniref:Dipeptidase n=1 Tax=Thyridium curvatum TaxID=1093900 RepID=A0A507AUP8_9PEZI|nr:uncharacterized protein E0L32_008655 [Thyridium curvatum]TPX10436.1 hypothetical protein E0L32_008655 [Thyridium curvatum]
MTSEKPSSQWSQPAPRDSNRPSSSFFTKGKALIAVGAILALGFFTNTHTKCMPAAWRGPSLENLSVEERASKILRETPLIDGHIDLPIYIRYLFNNHISEGKFPKLFEDGGLPMHLDLPRLRSGQSGGAFWSVFIECPKDGQDISTENQAESVVKTLQQIDVMTRLKEAYPDVFSPMVNSSDALAAFKKGLLISPLGIEGLHQIGNSAANLRRFYDLGVRYCTLSHNCPNKYVDAALWENPFRKAPSKWGGVSEDGRELLNEMNRLGMIIDLSHTSVETQIDVLGGGGKDWAGSKAPVIYSHSSAYALCPHPRNVPDDVLQLVKKRNSLVMVNFAPDFISCTESDNENGLPDFDPEHSTLAQIAKHIMHIGDLIGYDHVGIGSDFDGIQTVPRGMEDVSKYPDLVAELLRNGVSDADAAKVVGGNILRVWQEIDKVALEMQAAGEPILEDDLPDLLFQEGDAFGVLKTGVQ